MADFLTTPEFKAVVKGAGFNVIGERNVTKEITPTAKRMYWSYLIGGPLAVVYNLFNKPSSFARNHYKSGLYQYKALKKGLWNYSIILFEKT